MASDDPLIFGRFTPKVSRPYLREQARRLLEEVAQGRPFTCLLTNDRQLRQLNREFLQHDYPTDVLSFPSASPGALLGEIAISVNRAEAQAREFGHTTDQEIAILMLHGVLHLMGLDHEQDRGEMADAEQRWRTKLGYPSGLIERVHT